MPIGLKSPPDGCRDPSTGQRHEKGVCTGEEEDVSQRHLGRALPRGVVPSPLGRWPWKVHDVTQDAYDVIQH
jgi:hypothetical protein